MRETRTDDQSEIWIDWAVQRPVKQGLYWWRVRSRDYGGVTLRPEWVSPLTPVGMGVAAVELWPSFSRWDGYQRSVPFGTQWSLAGPEATDKQFVFRAIELKPCPFCGREPTFSWSHMAVDCGRYIGSAPYQANQFKIDCRCRLAGSHYRADLKELIEQWNRRAM